MSREINSEILSPLNDKSISAASSLLID